jgi:hypothetical protein
MAVHTAGCWRVLLLVGILPFVGGLPVSSVASEPRVQTVELRWNMSPPVASALCHVPDEHGEFGSCDRASLLATLPIEDVDEASLPAYDRPSWNYPRGSCPNTRGWVLIEESLEPVTFTTPNNCTVATGRWVDPYTGQEFTNAADLQIDHLVPLANAHYSGGWAWSPEQKAEFANDFSYPAHLIGVDSGANQEKGRRGPEAWWPVEAYWCQYAMDWIWVKHVWDLSVTQAEWDALDETLAGWC